jgi:hypothetical protein
MMSDHIHHGGPVDDTRLIDAMLRAAGFKLIDPRTDSEPIWEKDGHAYTESEAWAELNRRVCEGRK